MENEFQFFRHKKFGKIRVLFINGEIYFVGRDVATALGYTNPAKAIRDHVDEEDKKVVDLSSVTNRSPIADGIPEGWIKNEVIVINESGLYSLILTSKIPDAKEFKHWVTAEVLPSIRKHGYYIPNEDAELAELLNKTPAPILDKVLNQTQAEIDDAMKIQPLFKLLDYCGGNVKLREKLIILIAETITGKTL